MKYCVSCKKIHEDDANHCSFCYSSELKLVPDEHQVCDTCASKENLYKYNTPWFSGSYTYGGKCTCKICYEKLQRQIERESKMKYLIIDDNEPVFCESTEEVNDYLKRNFSDCSDGEPSTDSVVILKLEKRSDYLTEKHFRSPGQPHIVVYDDEIYEVIDAMEPTVEFDHDLSISW